MGGSDSQRVEILAEPSILASVFYLFDGPTTRIMNCRAWE